MNVQRLPSSIVAAAMLVSTFQGIVALVDPANQPSSLIATSDPMAHALREKGFDRCTWATRPGGPRQTAKLTRKGDLLTCPVPKGQTPNQPVGGAPHCDPGAMLHAAVFRTLGLPEDYKVQDPRFGCFMQFQSRGAGRMAYAWALQQRPPSQVSVTCPPSLFVGEPVVCEAASPAPVRVIVSYPKRLIDGPWGEQTFIPQRRYTALQEPPHQGAIRAPAEAPEDVRGDLPGSIPGVLSVRVQSISDRPEVDVAQIEISPADDPPADDPPDDPDDPGDDGEPDCAPWVKIFEKIKEVAPPECRAP